MTKETLKTTGGVEGHRDLPKKMDTKTPSRREELLRKAMESALQEEEQRGAVVRDLLMKNEIDNIIPLLQGKWKKLNGGAYLITYRNPWESQGDITILVEKDKVVSEGDMDNGHLRTKTIPGYSIRTQVDRYAETTNGYVIDGHDRFNKSQTCHIEYNEKKPTIDSLIASLQRRREKYPKEVSDYLVKNRAMLIRQYGHAAWVSKLRPYVLPKNTTETKAA